MAGVVVRAGHPGFGGQAYSPPSTGRSRRRRAALDALGSEAELGVDGGVKIANAAEIAAAGADVLVAGSAVVAGGGSIADNIGALRAAAA